MIKFESDEFIYNLDVSISEYNNRYWDEKDKEKIISQYDSEKGIDEQDLKKLQDFRLVLNVAYMSSEELDTCNNDLKKLVKNSKLETIHIMLGNSRNKKQVCKFDVSFLDELTPDVKLISLIGIDMSNQDSKLFSRFTSLRHLNLSHTNISNLGIISDINENCNINITRNEIDKQYTDEFVQLMLKHNGNILVSDSDIGKLAKAIHHRQVKLSEYNTMCDKIDFSTLPNLEIFIDDDIDISDEELKSTIDKINLLSNARIKSNAKNYMDLNKKYNINLPADIIIKNASELSCDDLTNNPNIVSIKMEDGLNTAGQQSEPYTRESYLLIRAKIDEILKDMPKDTDEKNKFTYIYKKIAENIEYDGYAISEEGKKDKNLEITCRNLYGGLIEEKCVCAGYADILRNVCACAGIEAKFIGGGPNTNPGHTFNMDNSHAWNCVKLDNEWFYTDITWDRDNVILGKLPLRSFLKSTEDFHHEEYASTSFDDTKKLCKRSITDAEQIALFTGKEIQDEDAIQDTKALARNSLSSCALRTASRGISSSHLIKASNLLVVLANDNKEDKNIK